MWSRSPKKSKNRRRISLLCMRPIRGYLASLAFHLLQLDPQVFEGAPQKAGDVHLAHAYVVRDLGLRLALVEAQLQDLLLLALETLDGLLKQDPVLQTLYGGSVVGLEVHDRVPVRLVLAHGRVQARRVVGPPQRQRLRHTLYVSVERFRKVLQTWRLTRPGGLVADHFLGRLAQLLQAARHTHRPTLVTEVAFDLPEDIRGRIGGELDLPVHVETVDGLYQADGGDLDQVVQWLSAAGELAGQKFSQGELFLDDTLAGALVALLVVAHQQAPGTRFVGPAVAPAHDTSSTTVRQVISPLPLGSGSSTSARTPSSASEKRKRVGASPAWKPSRISTASSSPPTPTLARAAIPASTRPAQGRRPSWGGSLR